MKKFLSLKLNWKRAGFLMLIGISISLLGCFIYYYFAFYLPKQEFEKEKAKTDSRFLEIEKQIYEAKGLPLPKD